MVDFERFPRGVIDAVDRNLQGVLGNRDASLVLTTKHDKAITA